MCVVFNSFCATVSHRCHSHPRFTEIRPTCFSFSCCTEGIRAPRKPREVREASNCSPPVGLGRPLLCFQPKAASRRELGWVGLEGDRKKKKKKRQGKKMSSTIPLLEFLKMSSTVPLFECLDKSPLHLGACIHSEIFRNN